MDSTGARHKTRRNILRTTSGVTIATLAGCLRLTEDEEVAQPSGGTETPSGTGDGDESRDGGMGEQTYTIDEFHPVADSFQFNRDEGDVVADPSALAARTTSGDTISIDGQWNGDEQLFAHQACALYSFEILENDTVVLASNEQVLMIYYLFRAVQTAEELFVTCQPSVNQEWDSNLTLTGAQDTGNVPAQINRDQRVFEIDLSQADVRPGGYDWQLEVTPPNNHTFVIGGNYEDLISVGADETDGFPSRTEAIAEASEPSDTSADSVASPGDAVADLTIGQKAYYFGEIESTRNITRDISVQCPSGCDFTPDHALRVNNLTTSTSLSFSLL